MLTAAALAVGLLVGVVSGLTGIGGGVLMVPFLYVLYGHLGVRAEDSTILAHATSLAVIVPTGVRGLLGFRGTGLVRWRAALPLAVVAMAAAALSTRLALIVPAEGLRAGFGCFLMLVASDLLLRRERNDVAEVAGNRHTVLASLVGVPTGMLSALLGVGGGIPATVGMYYILRLPFRVLAPTSLAIITVTAAAGASSYLLAPAGPLPFGWVVGRVDFGHALPLALGAVAAAPAGVALHRRLPVRVLQRVFGVILLVLGIDILINAVLR